MTRQSWLTGSGSNLYPFASFPEMARTFSTLQREMNPLFGNRDLPKRGSEAVPPSFPSVNVFDANDSIIVIAEAPGVENGAPEVSLTGTTLTIKGERHVSEAETFHRTERATGAFHRIVRLPEDVRGATATAEFRDGLLKVTLPKSPAHRPRRITVKAS